MAKFQGPTRPGTSVSTFRSTGRSVSGGVSGRRSGPLRPGTDEEIFRKTGQSVQRGSKDAQRIRAEIQRKATEAAKKVAEAARRASETARLEKVREQIRQQKVSEAAFRKLSRAEQRRQTTLQAQDSRIRDLLKKKPGARLTPKFRRIKKKIDLRNFLNPFSEGFKNLTPKQKEDLTLLQIKGQAKELNRIKNTKEFKDLFKLYSKVDFTKLARTTKASVPLSKSEAERLALLSFQLKQTFKRREDFNPFSRDSLESTRKELLRTGSRKDKNILEKIGTQVDLFSVVFASRVLDLKDLPAGLLALVRNPANIKQVPAAFLEETKQTINLLRTSPTEGLARVGADFFTFKLVGKTLKTTGKVTKAGATKLFPKRLGTTVSPFGVRTIEKVRKVGKIEIIPQRGTKLKVKPLKALKEAQLSKQLKEVPKLAPTSKIEKRVLKIVKKRGDAVSGSFAQESLLKKQFAKRHKDLDILTKNRPKIIKDLKKEFGKDIKFKKRKVSIEVIHKGKPIADLIEFKVGEGGLVKKFGVQKVGGVNLASQKARLAAKVRQLGMETVGRKTPKGKKVIRDIELLTGKRVALDRAAIKGAFDFSEKELKQFIGKRGPLTTAQTDLFKSLRNQLKGAKDFKPNEIIKTQFDLINKKVFTPKELKLKKWLYATPADPKTGIAQTRISRLGLTSGQEASLRDLLRGQASFKKGKSAIYVFPDEKIFKSPGKLTKGKTVPTPDGFVVPLFSSELEVVLGKNFIIKRGKKLATRIIDGDKVSVFELKKIRIPKNIQSDLNKLRGLNKKVSKKGFKKNSKAGKELVKRIDAKEKAVNVKLKKTTGFDYFSKPPTGKKVFPVKRRIATRAIKKVSKVSRRKPVSKVSRRVPISRAPSRLSVPSRAISKRPISKAPSRPSKPLKAPSKPSRGISRPSRGKKGLKTKERTLVSVREKGKVSKKLKAPVPVFNVLGKSGKKFVKLNKIPFTRNDALSRGAFAIDNTTSKTFKIIPAGKSKEPGALRKGEKNYFNRNRDKLRAFKVKKGKRFEIKPKFIEKTKFAIDTRGEKSGLTVAKFVKQRQRKPLTAAQRKVLLRNLAKARKVRARNIPTRKPVSRITIPSRRKPSSAQLAALAKGRAKLKKLRKK